MPAYATLLAGLLATGIVWKVLDHRHDVWVGQQLQQQAAGILENFNAQTEHRIIFLHGVQGFFAARTNIDLGEFERFVEATKGSGGDPAVMDLGFAPRITAADWPAFRTRMLAEGFSPFNFPQQPPALDQGECFPIAYYTDQRSRASVPVGFVMNAETNRLETIRRAGENGIPVATGPVKIFSTDNQHDEKGVLLIAPVYNGSAKQWTTPEDRRRELRGIVFVSLASERLWREAVGDYPGLRVRFYQDHGQVPERLVFDSENTSAINLPPAITYTMSGMGRDWTLAIHPLPNFRATLGPLRHSWLVAAGAVATLGVFLAMHLQASGRRRSESDAYHLALSETDLKRRERALTALADLGHRLGAARQVGEWVEPAVRLLGTAAAADRACLFLAHDDPELGRCVSERAEWCAPGTTSQAGDSRWQRIPITGPVQRWMGIFEQDGFVSGLREDFSPEEQSLMDAWGAQSLLLLPLRPNDSVRAFLSFNCGDDARAWQPDEIELLRGGCNALSLALERLDAEDRLSTEAQRLAVTLESIGDAVVATDRHGGVRLLNRVASLWAGRSSEEARGIPVEDVLRMDDGGQGNLHGLIQHALEHSRTEELPGSFRLRTACGGELTVTVSVAALRHGNEIDGAVICVRDVTERRRLEMEQLRASKLESIGQLAGGIAHDFNNLLAAMLGNVSLAQQLQSSPTEWGECLRETEQAIWRARSLTQQLLTFAKGGAPVSRPTDVGALANEAVALAVHGTPVKVETELPSDLWGAEVDPTQLTQVFQNLTLNAVQAMGGTGRIWLTARNVPAGAAGRPTALKGDAVCLVVRDKGPGLSPQAMSRLFEPYFTTNPGRSGLGLATAYNIVRRHGGLLTADSSPGQGARFSVWLPASGKAPARPPAAPAPKHPLSGRLLVMDDDRAVQSVAVMLARRAGLEAAAASNGEEAIEVYGRAMAEGRRFDAVLLDLTVVGGMGGMDTLVNLRQMDPEVVAVVTSGYSNDPVMANFEAEGFRGILPKPYSAEQFTAVLRAVMVPKRNPPPKA